MANPTWGMLAKSLVDDETIEEAIGRLILAHNEDEEAHLGAGQSLFSHKASEIIDHVVASIIADKIKDSEVTTSKLSCDRFEVHPSFESLDCWVPAGVGDVWLRLGFAVVATGFDSGNAKSLLSSVYEYPLNLAEKNPVIEFVCVFDSGLAMEGRIGFGHPIFGLLGFKAIPLIQTLIVIGYALIFSLVINEFIKFGLLKTWHI